MTLSLTKGQKLSLAKEAPSMVKCLVGLGWTAHAQGTTGAEFDLDASAFLLNAQGKCRSEGDFVFYKQPKSTCGSVVSSGDNRTGSAAGSTADDEQITVDLSRVPADVERIAFTVTIYDFEARKQNFGMVRNAFIRLQDAATGAEVCRFDLSEQSSTETALIFAELYRKDGSWRFNAVGQGYAGGLKALATSFGLSVD
ncbi:MAG TPA: TerD family protein [Drouetiella sp.]|jgi:tellurium resistance protein TerD